MTIKILLFLFSKQLFSSFPPENIANCEIIKNDLTDIYSIFSCNSKEIKERDKEITTIKKNKENIIIVYLYYQLIHEKNLYFTAAIVVVAVLFMKFTKKFNNKLFIVFIKNIKKTLKSRKYTNLILKVFKKYYKFLDVFF